jgi:protein-tyrosine phosphatase
MAEGAFRQAVAQAGLSERILTDSAGTIGFHTGSAPDPRAQETARANGVDISAQRARQVRADDFTAFDYILAMDRENFLDLTERCPPDYLERISLFMQYAPDHPYEEMPDPYYGARNQFDLCFKAAVQAADGLLDVIRQQHFSA